MSFSITLGWWIVPVLLNIATVLWAFWRVESVGDGGGAYAMIGAALICVFYAGTALILMLATWLGYFIIGAFA